MSSMRIKRPLPPAPQPTRPCKRDLSFLQDGTIAEYRPSPLKTVDTDKVDRSAQNGRAVQTSKAHEKWEKMAKMAGAGWSDKEIAEALQYTEKYVHERLKRLRRSGVNIPERKRGRKHG